MFLCVHTHNWHKCSHSFEYKKSTNTTYIGGIWENMKIIKRCLNKMQCDSFVFCSCETDDDDDYNDDEV